MFCRNCGQEVHPQAVACPKCGVPPNAEKKFCPNCGVATEANQAACTQCGVSLVASASSNPFQGPKNKLVAGLLGILLGSLGIHKFYLGYNKEGIIMLVITLLTCGIGGGLVSIIGLIEGIIYLTKTDEDFEQTYVKNQKPWF
ncbi:MAG TPA: TM2 domain-containing protein [Lentisphaeria bacterium]|mgnify:CR=1 FL=1|nr:TM2 domain-containing protein [Lentisphaeria bacterium]